MLKDLLQSVRDWAESRFLKLTGGTMSGALTTTALTVKNGSNQSAGLNSDGEGGNVWWVAPDESHNEIDSYNNTHTRIYNFYQGNYHEVTWMRSKNYNLDNFVLKSGDTMTGALTTTNLTVSGSWAKFNGQVINYVNGQRGTTPSANQYRTYEFHDTNGKRLSQVESGLLTDGTNVLNLFVLGHFTSSDSYSGMRIKKSLNATGATTLLYDANTGQLSGINKLTFRAQLYYNATGTDGSVGLSASAANYNHMRIYFKKNGDTNARGSTDVFSPNGNRASLVLGNYASPTIQIAWKTVTISGTSIAVYSQSHMIENTSNGSWGAGASDAKVYIYRVEAWNE